jgi:hypothetical protein
VSATPADGGRRRAQVLVASAIVASLGLVGAYLAAGGTSYAPKKTADPCKQRPWRDPEGLQELAEQISLSALDGAACQLGVSREALAQALPTEEGRERFARRYGIGEDELARAVRAGLLRAIDDAEEAGALSPVLAGPLRNTVEEVPIDQAIGLIEDARALLSTFQGFIGPAEDFLEELLP